MLQIISTTFSILWLLAVLGLLFLIWRNSIRLLNGQQVLSTVALKNAESADRSAIAAQKSAEAAWMLANQGKLT